MSYVSELIDSLKLPAIEAYAASREDYVSRGARVGGWDPHTDSWIEVSGYAFERGSYHVIVAPPHADGNGGGKVAVWLDTGKPQVLTSRADVSMYADIHEFTVAFDEVRSRLDSAFGTWLDLPQALVFDSQVTSAAHALRRLQLDLEQVQSWLAGGAYPEYLLGSDLSVELATVGRVLSDDGLFGGLTLDTVKRRYAAGAQRAVAGLYAMSTVCGGHIAAEQQLWKGARQDLFLIIDKARGGLVESAKGGGAADWTVILSVVGVAIQGLSLIATASGVGAGAGLALGGIGLAVETLEEVVADQETRAAVPANFETVMSAIESSLADLAASIRHEEGLIASNIEANLRHIRDDATKYDLTGVMFDDNNERNSAIRFDTVNAPSVSVAMRHISDELDAAARYFPFFDVTTACRRDPSIGLGATGPAVQIEEFATVIKKLLDALSLEFSLGAGNWDAATELFAEQENSVQGIVYALESQIDLSPVASLGGEASALDPLESPAASG